jgi:hypothetical protein
METCVVGATSAKPKTAEKRTTLKLMLGLFEFGNWPSWVHSAKYSSVRCSEGVCHDHGTVKGMKGCRNIAKAEQKAERRGE